ncbi:ABC transporter ATP-binding protein [Dactylosporangium sucinum]|uniref:ABC transporter ATP-binding protein n=1 Tax=Dactylosporangium sucinum TaxID=1424081 RepID=A0A917X084_9ACTN|nr:ABC transporter ATP-binding protein [Dactylosporangium sucinum]GGM45733.1 ABC transporter ATP-binding protein [Dactylosporangium sucinum]
MSELLRVEGLNVTYRTRGGLLPAARGVSLTLRKGEILGLVGESGSGKSTVLTALMRMLPRSARVAAGRVDFDGTDLLSLGDAPMRRLRGRRIGLIPQRPMTSLSPVTTVRKQLALLSGGVIDDVRAQRLLTDVGLGGLYDRLGDYPFQFSGGQLQRMLMAVAVLAHEPDLVLADEPTTTLDVTVQAQILRLLLDLRNRLGNSVIFVSHDLAVLSQVCDRVGVMYGGQLVEAAETRDLFTNPQHPYTRALLDAMPSRRARGERLRAIPGTVSGSQRLPGCPFAPRCDVATDLCAAEAPPPRPVAGSTVRCHHAGATS